MSAKRFGGQYSPQGSRPADGAAQSPKPNKFRGKSAASVDVRSILMFFFPTPLLFAALSALSNGAAVRMLILLAAYACLMLGAWLLREGQKAHIAFDERAIAKAPAFPRKLFAAGLAGIGVCIAAFMSRSSGGVLEFGGNVISALLFGGLAIVTHIASFGIDPMKSKGFDEIGAGELDRVHDAIDKAESKLKSIEDLAHKLRDREIDDKVSALNATVRDMIKMVEEDPRDLSRARRYLGVYLKGAEEATRKYADNHERLNDPEIRREYLDMLGDLEQSFTRGKETLLLDDRTDLEVEIEVLRERLQQEGT
jgi:5-bromo-4-chloroindolyl phosphate hydrolysis protein